MSAVGSGLIVARTGRYRWAIWSGWICLSLGCGLLQLLETTTATAVWVFITLIPGIGLGLLFTTSSSPAQASTPTPDRDTAAALCSFFRSMGQSLGVVIGNAVFLNRVSGNLTEHQHESTHNLRDALGLLEILSRVDVDAKLKTEIIRSISDSLDVLWWTIMALSLLAGMLSLATRGLTLDQDTENRE